jgi:cell division protein FtsL
MGKNKKKSVSNRREKVLYRMFVISTIFLVLGIIYSKAMMSKINLEIQELSDTIKEETDDNQSLAMKINEMVSLDKIQEVSHEQGLTYNNENIKSVSE